MLKAINTFLYISKRVFALLTFGPVPHSKPPLIALVVTPNLPSETPALFLTRTFQNQKETPQAISSFSATRFGFSYNLKSLNKSKLAGL
jgi:hypothetical protein